MPDNSDLDAHLLAALRQDSRTHVSDLAKTLGVSRAAVYAGIARLEKDGIIAGYTVRLGAAHGRRTVRAHVMIKVAPKLTQATVDELSRMPAIAALHAIAGDHDLIAMIEAESLDRLNEIIDAIGMLDGVARTISSIILATRLQR